MTAKTAIADLIRRTVFMNPLMERWLLHVLMNWSEASFINGLRKVAPNYYQYKTGTRRRCFRRGLKFDLDISRYHEWMIYYNYPTIFDKHLFPRIKSGDVIVDVGANIGDFSLHASRLCLPEGQVHAFEPVKESHDKLRHFISVNKIDNVVLNRMAVGSEHSSVSMQLPSPRNPGTAHVAIRGDDRNMEVIPAIPLDHYIDTRSMKNVSCIKIDVEGYELQVLKGAAQTIERFHPLLFIELIDRHLRKYDVSAGQVIEWLNAEGYAVMDIRTHREIIAHEMLDGISTNIVCEIRQSSH